MVAVFRGMNTIQALVSAALITSLTGGCTTTLFSGPDQGGNGGSGGGGSEVCETFEDTTEASPLSVRVTNDTIANIYVTADDCDTTPYPDLFDADGKALVYRNHGNCGFTCEMLQSGPPVCTAEACAAPPVVVIAPGGSFEMGTWNGTVLDSTEMPLACHFEPFDDRGSCDQRIAAPAGDYEVGVRIYSAIECIGESCSCDFVDGSCQIPFEAAVVGEPRVQKVAVTHPGDDVVDVVIQ